MEYYPCKATLGKQIRREFSSTQIAIATKLNVTSYAIQLQLLWCTESHKLGLAATGSHALDQNVPTKAHKSFASMENSCGIVLLLTVGLGFRYVWAREWRISTWRMCQSIWSKFIVWHFTQKFSVRWTWTRDNFDLNINNLANCAEIESATDSSASIVIEWMRSQYALKYSNKNLALPLAMTFICNCRFSSFHFRWINCN